MARARIAVVGDSTPASVAHQGVNASFALARRVIDDLIELQWLGTETIAPDDKGTLQGCDGIWCVPGSPYRNANGALWAIQFARTMMLPFLGTCGGYQHALLEFARNELNLPGAGHREDDPSSPTPLVDRMRCALIEQIQQVTMTDPSFAEICGASSSAEGYHCSYGLNPAYETAFAGSSMRIVARSPDGEARAVQLYGHPF